MNREFHLSPQGKGGVACDAAGAFIGPVSLLAKAAVSGGGEWRPRACDDLSEELSAQYGLPIDMSSKSGGLMAIANALNAGELARAQIATVLLGIPDPPQLFKGAATRERAIKLIRDLHWSGMLKWDPDEHPRWPAGQSDGGQFRPVSHSGSSAGEHDQPGQNANSPHEGSSEFWSNLASTLAAGAVEVAGNVAIGAEEIGTEGVATPAVPAEEAGLQRWRVRRPRKPRVRLKVAGPRQSTLLQNLFGDFQKPNAAL